MLLALLTFVQLNSQNTETDFRVEVINKKVMDIDEGIGLKTPASASAQYNRAVAMGLNSKLEKISSPAIKEYIPKEDTPNRFSEEKKNSLLNSMLVEAIVYKDSIAAVIRQERNSLLIQYLSLQNGEWLSEGEDFGEAGMESTRAKIKEKAPLFFERVYKK